MAFAPEMDPAFLAFQRALGIQESDLRASIAQRTAAVQRDVAMKLPMIQQQTEQNVRQAGGNFEARGVFGSGRRAEAQSQQALAGGLQQQQIVGQGADQIAGLDSELARQISDNRRRTAEAELEARQRLAIGGANEAGLF